MLTETKIKGSHLSKKAKATKKNSSTIRIVDDFLHWSILQVTFRRRAKHTFAALLQKIANPYPLTPLHAKIPYHIRDKQY